MTQHARASDSASSNASLPDPDGQTGLEVLKSLIRERSTLAALKTMRDRLGNAFRVTLPLFSPVIVSGHKHNRQLLVTERHKLRWRGETDPVTKLLGHGMLVTDDAQHDAVKQLLDPFFGRQHVQTLIPAFVSETDHLIDSWQVGQTVQMLDEMRRLTLQIIFRTLFSTDILPDLERLWPHILKVVNYISPGLWIIWPEIPRPAYQKSIEIINGYLHDIIERRRTLMEQPNDMLAALLAKEGQTDEDVRDQMVTMMVAGHDTCTAFLAWAFYALGKDEGVREKMMAEITAVLGSNRPPTQQDLPKLTYLDQIIKEALRLYPPVHMGNRHVTESIEIDGCPIPADTRLMYSIYLTHQDKAVWEEPEKFCPARFERGKGKKRPSFSYLPFGGGPRTCIGAIFAQVEAKIILARIFQRCQLELLSTQAHAHMGAALEPRPGIMMRVKNFVG